MRKNVKNEKVIRAMAIGISAMLTMAEPITALAAEGEGEGTVPAGGDGETIEQKQEENEVFVDAKDAVDAAEGAVETAKSAAGTVKDDVIENVVAGEATDENGKDLAQAVIDAANKIENTTATETEEGDAAEDDTAETEEGDAAEGGTAETEEGDAAEDDTAKAGNGTLAGAQTDITNADTQLDIAEANDDLSDIEIGKAEEAAQNVGDIAEDVMQVMQDAETKANEQLAKIEGAETVEEANAAYDELEETADQAQKDFDAKLADYNAAKASYDDAAAKVEAAEKAYNDAITNAGINAEQAEKELADAKKNAADLEVAVAAAKEAVDTSAKSALVIAEKENKTQTDVGLNWRNEDELFVAIMENYYLPEKLGISGATVTRVQGKDNNDYNYFTAVYKDENGVEQTKYYNFKMDNGSKDDIVIFEKRIEEVNWEEYQNTNPDQYVDKDGKGVDTTAGVADGTIVEVEGKYVIKNGMTGSETLVSDSEITKTSTEDVTVDPDKENWKESWQYNEETGELVKTITADVTTITYTDAKFTSEESYATDAERDAEAAKKEAELEKATGKDATVNETEETTYTYTASGTYIPTFTKTVNVKNEEVESGRIDWLREANSDAEAVAIVKKEQENKLREDDDLYYINIKSDLAVSGHTKDKWYDDSDYLVSGTVSATYAKVTKQTVDQSTFGAIWNDIKSLFGGQSTNEKLEEAARSAIEADGGIFLSANWDDWSFNKATIRYVAGVKVTTDEKQTEQDAKNAVQGAALAQAKANGATGVYNVKTAKDANAIEHKTYSYEINYLEKDEEKTEGKAIANETYANAEVLTGQIIQNLNYVKGNILLTQDNEEYRAFVDDAKDLTDKYARLLTEAQDAQKAVVAAQEEVDNLQKEIEELGNRKGNLDTLLDLEAQLKIAEANSKKAEGTLNDILGELKKAGTALDEVIEKLTPVPGDGEGDQGGEGGAPAGEEGDGAGDQGGEGGAPAGDAGDQGDEGGTPAGDEDDADDTDEAVTTPVVLATAPTAPVNVVASTPVAQTEVVEIEDDVTPLAPSVEENVQEEVTQEEVTQEETGTEEPETEETIQIDDEVTPLADIVVEDEQTKMSWWWLLIVLLLGTTGYEMYKKHNEKKQKAQAENAEDAE